MKTHRPAVEFVHLGMKFGDFTALEDINLVLEPYRFHVILGENGAGKSTLMKCLVGYQRPTSGQIVYDGRECSFASPRDAHKAGLGMVYQNFTLADNLTVGENFQLAREDLPFLLNTPRDSRALEAWMKTQPFTLPLEVMAGTLAAGEKQKLEILMQLYRKRKVLILDEPSSVLTPDEADSVLGMLKAKVEAQELTVILITHKFREFQGYGDTVAVLRRGRLVASGEASRFSPRELGALMVGEEGDLPSASGKIPREPGGTVLQVDRLTLPGARGGSALDDLSLEVREGEVLGLAGVSGNGQKELMEVFMGLHPGAAGSVKIRNQPFAATREFREAHGLSLLPELPVHNASVSTMSVWENLAFHQKSYHPVKLKKKATDLQKEFGIRAAHLGVPLGSLSGGNVQRTVLARELHRDPRILVVANPCFGLDFRAAGEIRGRITQARNQGAAVLLISEDLDEILELSDRVGVLSDGRVIWSGTRDQVNLAQVGQLMAGHREVSHE